MGFDMWKPYTFCHKKQRCPKLLEVDRQTIHAVPKYGIQIRCITGENYSFLEVKTFLSFLVFTLHHKFSKNCVFFAVNSFFNWSSHQFQRKASLPQGPAYATVSKCLKNTEKAITPSSLADEINAVRIP